MQMIWWCLIYHLHRSRQFFLQIRFHTSALRTFFRNAKSETTKLLNSMSIATQNHKNATKTFFVFFMFWVEKSELLFNFLLLMFEIDISVCGESRNIILIYETRVLITRDKFVLMMSLHSFPPFVCTTREITMREIKFMTAAKRKPDKKH